MDEILLSRGKRTQVDGRWYDMLSLVKWHIDAHGYARCCNPATLYKKQNDEKMHRVIMDAQSGQMIDHINGDKLDNRVKNLRFCSATTNQMNAKDRSGGTCIYKGVHFDKRVNKFISQIKVERKTIWLGASTDPEQMARAYDRAAIKYFGGFAKTNESLGLYNKPAVQLGNIMRGKQNDRYRDNYT